MRRSTAQNRGGEPLRVGVVHRRPAVEQERRQLVVAVVDGQAQCVLAVAGHRAEVGAARGEEARRGQVAFPRREEQGREPAVRVADGLGVGVRVLGLGALAPGGVGHRVDSRPRVDVGPVGNEQLDRLGVVLGHRPHQGGGAAPRLGAVHVGAAVEQQPDGVGPAGAGGHHERGVAVGAEGGVGVEPGVEKALDHRGAAVDGGEPHRGGAGVVRGVEGRSRANQQTRGLVVVPPRRPVQGGGAVHLRRVHLGARLDQPANLVRVSGHGRVGHFAGRGGAGSGAREDETGGEGCRDRSVHRRARPGHETVSRPV